MKRSDQFGKVLVTLLCVALAFFMTVEVSHSHPAGTTENAPIHCQFCATAHVATASQPSWLTGYVLHLIGIVASGEPSVGTRPVVFTTFIRPPPAEAALFV
jgi:hypothetical protein